MCVTGLCQETGPSTKRDQFQPRATWIATVDVRAVLNPSASADAFRRQADVAPIVRADPPALRASGPVTSNRAAPSDPQQTQAAPRVPRAVIDPQTHTAIIQQPDTYLGGVDVEQAPALALLRQIAYEDAQMRQALIQGTDVNAALVAAVQKIDTPA
jgi:hypothetical protein